jgi:hypothetical protein
MSAARRLDRDVCARDGRRTERRFGRDGSRWLDRRYVRRRGPDRFGKGRREAREQSVVCSRVMRIELCAGDREKARRRGKGSQRAQHRLELQSCIARGMLRERCIGEVDDVDVEMDDVAIRSGRGRRRALDLLPLRDGSGRPRVRCEPTRVARSRHVRTVWRPTGSGRRGRPGWRRATEPARRQPPTLEGACAHAGD